MCGVIGHDLTPDWRDRGVIGRYNACHSEKQLLAFLFFTTAQIQHEGKHTATRSGEGLVWPTKRKWITIYVDRPICEDCRLCIGRFRAVTGTSVRTWSPGGQRAGISQR